jgi:hypothetical protein
MNGQILCVKSGKTPDCERCSHVVRVVHGFRQIDWLCMGLVTLFGLFENGMVLP